MKKALIALTLCSTLSLPSCLGPNNLYNNLGNWNATATDMNWLNEVIYLGLNFIPVYPIFLLGDVWIFNTIDYWSGKDTWPTDSGKFPEKFSNK